MNKNVAIKTSAVASPQKRFISRHYYQLMVFVFSFLLFANSIPNEYNLDDELVTNNHRLTSKGISAIPEIFTSSYYNDGYYAYEYRPVVLATFAIENQFFGDNPYVSHFFNVILYGLMCVLLFNILSKLWPDANPIYHLAIAALFVAHPAHTEVVCNIKSRDEILALLFGLLTLQIAIRYLETKKWWRLLLVPVLFLLALMNKLSVISFAIIIPLTLTLFLQATMLQVLVLSVLLITTSMLMGGFASIQQALVIGSALLAVNVIIWLLAHYKSVATTVNGVYNAAIEGLSESPETYVPWKKQLNGLIFSEYIPNKSLLRAPAIALGICLFLLGVFSILLYNPIFIAIVVLSFITTLFVGNKSFIWWANIGLIGMIAFGAYYLPLSYTIFLTMAFIWIFSSILFGEKNLVLPMLLGMTLIILLVPSQLGKLNISVLILLTFIRLGVNNLMVVVFSASMFVHGIYEYYHANGHFQTLGFVYADFFSAIVYSYYRYTKRIRWLSKVSLILCLLVLETYVAVNRQNYNIPNNGLVNTLHNKPITIQPKGQNRPLEHVEQPVKWNDPVSLKVGTSTEILFHYFYKTMLPYPLAFYYGYKFIEPMPVTAPIALAGLIIYCLLGFLALFALIKGYKNLAYGLLIYLVSVVVFSNYLFPVPGLLADRFMLIPSLGWCIIFVWTLVSIFKIDINNKAFGFNNFPNLSKVSFLALLLVYSTITLARNGYWRDDITLFSHDISYVDNSAQAHNLLALHLKIASDHTKNAKEVETMMEQSVSNLEKACTIAPEFFNYWYDWGRTASIVASIKAKNSNLIQARQYLETAKNAFKQASALNPKFYDINLQLGLIYDQEDSMQQAAKYYQLVIDQNPLGLDAYTSLSFVYFKGKQYDLAIATNKAALEKIPNAYPPVENLAKTFLVTGQKDSALVWLEKAHAMNPKEPNVISALFDIYKEKGNKDKVAYYGSLLGIKQ